MNDKNAPKTADFLTCKCCDFKCSKKSDWDRHNLTLKHKKNDKRMTNDDKNTPKTAEKFVCECGKEYKHRQGLWSHKKKCESAAFPPTESEQPSNNIIVELLKQNKEFKELIIEQNKQIMELAKEKNTVINNTTNNSNTNNNQFNLQFFLNEQCKDALNLGDFVEQIKLQLSDLDMIGRVGYVEGMSKIFMRNLHALDVFKRPIHCSDLKRETLYIKDKNAWEKENSENIKIKRAIKGIENKNIKQIPFWVKENPASEDFETKKHMEYQNILLEAMGGSTLEDDNKKCDKIIRNIAKEVVIDKK
uniref:C2H2-type domain-containing protein n=1 Tax=viral metagenome TaxID=1070528 RepID=A0A6C0K125_9ZZZZ